MLPQQGMGFGLMAAISSMNSKHSKRRNRIGSNDFIAATPSSSEKPSDTSSIGEISLGDSIILSSSQNSSSNSTCQTAAGHEMKKKQKKLLPTEVQSSRILRKRSRRVNYCIEDNEDDGVPGSYD